MVPSVQPMTRVLTAIALTLIYGFSLPAQVCEGRNHQVNTATPYVVQQCDRLGVRFVPSDTLSTFGLAWYIPFTGSPFFGPGTTEIQTEDPSTGLPSGTVLASGTLPNAVLPAPGTWITGWFAPVQLDGGTPYWVTYWHIPGLPSEVGVQNNPPGPNVTTASLQTGVVTGNICLMVGATWGPRFSTDRFKVRLMGSACGQSTMTLGAAPAIGTTVPVLISSPTNPLWPYLAAFAAGTTPGIPTGDGRVVPLNPDWLLNLSLAPSPLFLGLSGVLDATGSAVANIVVPGIPSLVGSSVFGAFIVVDVMASSELRVISPPLTVTFQ